MKFAQYLKEQSMLLESGESFEIENTKSMSKLEATSVIRKHYPDNLTYKGMEFFSKIYIDTICKVAKKALGVDRDNGQESYLGYLPEEDMFISGWDTRPKTDAQGNVVYLKVDDKGVAKVINVQGKAGKGMYGKGGSLKDLHITNEDLIDIRLD